jgi:cytochrome c nitrite reductase small subunit
LHALLGKSALVLAVLLGVFIGVGTFTFDYAEGTAYLSNDPAACANCHVMQDYYDSWQKASHHTVATCNDCHLPHGFVGKYIAKADNGFRHSWANTFQNYHEPIQIIERNSIALQKNCLHCHQGITHNMLASSTIDADLNSCVHCHSDVGHGPPK